MVLKMHRNSFATLSLVWLILMVVFTRVHANSYDVLCPDSDNPLNFPLSIPMESLGPYVYVDFGPVAVNYIDPRDVACKENYDDITVEQFHNGVRCLIKGSSFVECNLHPKCISQRKRIFSRLRKATMKALDEAVLKIDAIKMFNMFMDEKFLLFGKESIGNLTGLEIMKRVTLGKVNLLNGFSISNKDETRRIRPSIAYDFLGKAASLYFRLKEAEDPTGSLARGVTCTIDNVSADVRSCYSHFLNSLRSRSELHESDSKLLSLLDESLDFIMDRLSDDRRRFSGLKIPFTGDCIGTKGVEPKAPYSKLLDIFKKIKSH